MTESIFAAARTRSYPYHYVAELHVPIIVGGVPSDPKVAEGWIRAKVTDSDDRIQELIAQTIVERRVDTEEAIKIVNSMKNLNGFKRTPAGVLYIEGRQIKAALKEAVSVAAAAGKIQQKGWGETKKWIKGFFPEHVFVVENVVELGVTEPSGILQQFPHTYNGSSIQYQEYVDDAVLRFNVVADWKFTKKDWEMIWTTGELQGLGASRSQGYGTYSVTRWDETIHASALKFKSGGADDDDEGVADEADAPDTGLQVRIGRKRTSAKAVAA